MLTARPASGQLSTEDHLAEPGFWPTQDNASRDNFTGPEACAQCHHAKAVAQGQTPMAQAAMLAPASKVLQTNTALGFHAGKYQYRIESTPQQSLYAVSAGSEKAAAPLLWAFGVGRVGQSYLFKKLDSNFYEARVTYFSRLRALEFTPFRALSAPSGLEEAMDRPVGQPEVMRCFGCHATASSIGGRFDETHLIPGVTCEACHGPGAAHVKAERAGEKGVGHAAKPAIFNSGLLSPTDAVEFCGACHGTLWDSKLVGVKGVSSARSAPSRLVTSRCWGEKGDARLTCTACHDPHEQLQTDAGAYDSACLSCHSAASARTSAAGGAPVRTCPVATSRCTTCHMVKVLVPEMHDTFTDHRIRIARAGEPFPD